MASIRLTKAIKESIINGAVRKHFDSDIPNHCTREISKILRDSIPEPEGWEKMMDYIVLRTTVYVEIFKNGQRISRESYSVPAYPAKNQSVKSFRSDVLPDKFMSLKKAIDEFYNNRAVFKSNLEIALKNVNTSNQLKELFPELEEYLPDEKHEIIPVDIINSVRRQLQSN